MEEMTWQNYCGDQAQGNECSLHRLMDVAFDDERSGFFCKKKDALSRIHNMNFSSGLAVDVFYSLEAFFADSLVLFCTLLRILDHDIHNLCHFGLDLLA